MSNQMSSRFTPVLCAIFTLLFFLCESGRGAPGDIRSMRVLGESEYGGIFNSWALEVGIEGLAPGGVYDLGLGKGGNSTNAKLVGQLQAWEFTRNLAPAQTLAMTIYGTRQLRKPFPDHEKAYEVPAIAAVDGYDGVKIIVALSEYIFKGDTLKVTLGAGLYIQKGVASIAVDKFPVTNLATLACPKVVGNWSWPDHQRITGDMTLRAVGFHGYAMGGKPLRRIRFSVTDTATPAHTVTTDVLDATIDKTMPDANPVIEYVAHFTARKLQEGKLVDGPVVCNFAAYPCRTDAQGNGILSTADGVNNGVALKYSPQHNYYDSKGTYGVAYAVVDSQGGDDATGTVASSLTNAPKPFLTLLKAGEAIARQNLARPEPYKRNNASGGVVYLKKGTYSIGVKGNPYMPDGASDVWLEIMPYPGVARADVVIGSDSGLLIHSRILAAQSIRFTNVTFARKPGQDINWWLRAAKPVDVVWLDRCVIDNSFDGTGPVKDTFYYFGLYYLTHSEWLCGQSNVGVYFNFMRGNTIRGAGSIGSGATILGNTAICGKDPKSNDYSASVDGFIYAFNRLLDQRQGNNLTQNGIITHGAAVVQNLFERTYQGGANTPVMSMDSSGSDCGGLVRTDLVQGGIASSSAHSSR